MSFRAWGGQDTPARLETQGSPEVGMEQREWMSVPSPDGEA